MSEKSLSSTIHLSAAGHLQHNGEEARVAESWDRLTRLVEQNASPERVCTELAQVLHVQYDGVALLRLQSNTLNFLFPSRLRTAGSIPLSSPAVAARTAVTRTTMLSNNFIKVRHVSVFEGVKLAEEGTTPTPIQKLISVPIFSDEHKVLGVVQVSRKGTDVSTSGPDFTHEDLHRLEAAAALIANLAWMHDADVIVKESVEGL